MFFYKRIFKEYFYKRIKEYKCSIHKRISRKKLNGIWNALSAVKLKPAIYAKIPDV
jgi:hypothetical protein